MKRPSNRHFLAAAVMLLLAVNAVTLGGVWYNRSGEPDSLLALSERELSGLSAGRHQENSGLALRLQWSMPGAMEEDGSRSSRTLSEAQMLQLGFRTPHELACQPRCPRQAAREVLVVLELDGPAYRAEQAFRQADVEQARQALAAQPGDEELQQRLEYRTTERDSLEHETRLYAVAVGLDRDDLRRRYPDRHRYAIVRGLVEPRLWDRSQRLRGYLSELAIEQINVSRQWRQQLENLPQHDTTTAGAAYRIEVAFGQRLEPWITAVSTPRP